jgi:hypothetical protein
MPRTELRARPAPGRVGACLAVFLLAAASPAHAQSAPALVLITSDIDAPDSGAATADGIHSDTVPKTPTKVEAGNNFEVAADNGWVIYQGLNNDPTLNFYDAFGSKLGSFKLVTPGGGPSAGILYDAGGIVFAPCAAGSKRRCSTSENGVVGVGLGFGQVNNGSPAGGWVSDDDLVAFRTNPDFAAGSIAAVAVNPGVAAYAVGWDDDATGVARATMLTLDATAGQTYAPTAQTDLGTLGGATSQALGISTGGTYIAGLATTAANKTHAVFATTATATSSCGAQSACWADLSSAIATAASPAAVIKSRALVANDAGYIAGSYDVKETLYAGTAGQRTTTVSVGFVYDINAGSVTLLPAAHANVVPLAVLGDGSVVGNLLEILPKGTTGLPVYHPFIAKGGTIDDLGLLTGEYSCRVNIPNHLGELVGACIPNGTTAFGAGKSFYINAEAATPAFVDLNADLHAMNDAANPTYKNYVYTTASSIDDEHEITVMGILTAHNGSITRAGFLAEPGVY